MMTTFPEIGNFTLRGGYPVGDIEGGFQAELLSLLRAKGYICFHPNDIGYAEKFLDVHLVTPGGSLHWIELKKIPGDTFNIKKFEDSQVYLLREFDRRNKEAARVGIYSIKRNSYKILTFSEIWTAANEEGSVKIFSN